jgi:group I intron endonuclease
MAWNKYGADSFKFQIIEIVDNSNVMTVEQWYLDNTRCLDRRYGYNISPFAENRKHTAETRQKMSRTKKGKTFSDEHRQNLCEARRRRAMAPETGQRISRALKGRIFSPEHRRKLSQRATERYQVVDISGGFA